MSSSKTVRITVRKNISKRTRFAVLNRDEFRCVYCGRSQADGVPMHVDHKLAVSKGGTNDLDNLVTACADCNLGKSNLPLNDNVDGRPHRKQTFGLSFGDDGRVHWQFVIEGVSEYAVKVLTFSWVSGDPWSTETVDADFIAERCELYTSQKDFDRAAMYWGDLRANRINEKFVKVPKRRAADVFG